MNIELKELETDELVELLRRSSEELKRRKDIINSGAERNEQLRQYLKLVVSMNREMIDLYREQKTIPSSLFLALEMHVNTIETQLEIR